MASRLGRATLTFGAVFKSGTGKIIMILPLLIVVGLACAQTVDPDVSANAESIFGTPDEPKVNQVTSRTDETDNTTLVNNIKELFPPPPDTLDQSTTTERPTAATTTKPEINLNPSPDIEHGSCTRSKDNRTGVCVPYYLCDPETKRLITDGSTLIDVRINDECTHYLDVCCVPEDVNTTTLASTAGPPAPAPADVGCGYSNFGDADAYRIVNDGTKAEFLEYPWMIALLRKTKAGEAWAQSDYLGGGSLIHPRVVLTAAHKVSNMAASDIKCRAGEWDTLTVSEIYGYQEKGVQKIIKHEDFYRPSVLNSIALLVLVEAYTPSPNIGIACLGRNPPPPSTRCYGMGWGKDDFNSEGKYANILKKVEVPLLSRSSCETALRRTRLGSFFKLHPSLTCAGGESGADTCSGDGGSPLVCPITNDPDRYAIYGMVAYGIGCGDAGIPGVYVNTPSFYGWITDKMAAEGFGSESFVFKE